MDIALGKMNVEMDLFLIVKIIMRGETDGWCVGKKNVLKWI